MFKGDGLMGSLSMDWLQKEEESLGREDGSRHSLRFLLDFTIGLWLAQYTRGTMMIGIISERRNFFYFHGFYSNKVVKILCGQYNKSLGKSQALFTHHSE